MNEYCIYHSLWTGPIPWTSTWRWWSTATGWLLLQLLRRCSAMPAESIWRNMVHAGCVSEDSNNFFSCLNVHCVVWCLDLFQALNQNTLPKLPGKTTNILPITRKRRWPPVIQEVGSGGCSWIAFASVLVQVFPIPGWVQFGAGDELQEGVWIPHPAAVLVRASDVCPPSPGQRKTRLWWDVGFLSPVLHRMAPELQFWPARPLSGSIIWRTRLWRLLPRRWQLTLPPPLKKTAAWRWRVISDWFKGAKQRETCKTFELKDAFWASSVLELPKHLEDASASP